jgi:23S rRNA (uracil1939-C5)-methyltransferase
VVLNPPRKGCAPEVLDAAARLAPRTIAYLSCSPRTLLRDLETLSARGYDLRRLIPLDMLPHTPHIELLALVHAPT